MKEDFKKIARINFRVWNATLQTKDPEKIAELYSSGATFLPTLSNKFEKGKKGARKYFKHFVLNNPDGKIIEEEIQPLGPNAFAHSGKYNFEIGPKNKRKITNARFTFIWNKDKNGDWKILHHHSSLVP